MGVGGVRVKGRCVHKLFVNPAVDVEKLWKEDYY